MYDGRDKNINSQTNSSTKHILNTYGGVMQNKIYCIYIMINIYILEYMLEYLIDERKHTGANQHLRANRVNFNLSHRINIQGEAQREWKRGFAKV